MLTAVNGQDQNSEHSERKTCGRRLHGIKTAHEGLRLCHMCYCQIIQPKTEKWLHKSALIRHWTHSITSCSKKQIIEVFAGGKSIIIRKKTSCVKSLTCAIPALIKKYFIFGCFTCCIIDWRWSLQDELSFQNPLGYYVWWLFLWVQKVGVPGNSPEVFQGYIRNSWDICTFLVSKVC